MSVPFTRPPVGWRHVHEERGALIAPDTGLLICDGPEHDSWPGRQNFIINYDSRVKNLLAIANQDFSSFNNWGIVRVTMVRNTGFAPLAP